MENNTIHTERKSAPAKKDPVKMITKALKKYRMLILAGAALVMALVLALTLALSVGSNNYKTPVKLMAAAGNEKKPSAMLEAYVEMLNGLGEDEMGDVVKIMSKTDAYDYLEDGLEYTIDYNQEAYGEKYKIKMTVVDKEKLDKDDLEEIQDKVDAYGEKFTETYERIQDMDSETEDYFEELGLSKKDIKKLEKAYKKLGKTFDKAKVTAGYELTVKTRITGSQLDEPEVHETTMMVYKIGGRWVCLEAIEMLPAF